MWLAYGVFLMSLPGTVTWLGFGQASNPWADSPCAHHSLLTSVSLSPTCATPPLPHYSLTPLCGQPHFSIRCLSPPTSFSHSFAHFFSFFITPFPLSLSLPSPPFLFPSVSSLPKSSLFCLSPFLLHFLSWFCFLSHLPCLLSQLLLPALTAPPLPTELCAPLPLSLSLPLSLASQTLKTTPAPAPGPEDKVSQSYWAAQEFHGQGLPS